MILPVLVLLGIAGFLEFDPGKIPIFQQFLKVRPLGQADSNYVPVLRNNRADVAHLWGHVVNMGELPQEVKRLVGVGDAEVRQYLGRHPKNLGNCDALLIVGGALALLVATNSEDADTRSFCEIVLCEPGSFSESLEGLS